ncbi:MAG: ribonuclease III [Dehalococcoidia bacterium]
MTKQDKHSANGPDLRALEKAIGTKFRDKGLLRQAVIHRSYLNEQQDSALESYERLEYLGDAFLGWIVAEELYRRYPAFDEGGLTRARAAVVQGRTLREIADELGLGPYILMGQGEEAHGGRQRQPTLAAVVEALIGAVLLDRGGKIARRLVLRWMDGRIRQLEEGARLDSKSALQELAQGRGMALPRYELLEESGPPHDRRFTVRVVLDGRPIGQGMGRRKGDAEQQAAAEAIAALSE